MLQRLFSRRSRCAPTRAQAPSPYRRRRLFEPLEDRRVLAASDVAIDLYVNLDLDPFGPPIQPGDEVEVFAAGYEITNNTAANIDVNIGLYQYDFDPDVFPPDSPIFEDELDFNRFVKLEAMRVATIYTTSHTAGEAGVYTIDPFTFFAPGPGSYWAILTITDNIGNAAAESIGMPFEVVGISLDASIGPIEGTFTPQDALSISGAAVGDTLNYDYQFLVFHDSNNDGSFDDEVPTIIEGNHFALDPTVTVSYTPTDAGNYKVVFNAAFGSQSASDEAFFSVNSTSFDTETGVLTVGGNSEGSSIQVSSGSLVVTVDGVTQSFNGVQQVVIRGGAGNDLISIAPNVTVPVVVYGGDGDDIILGGGGNDVLIGGDGNDLILGRGGRNLLIGGAGSDILIGGSGDDILIGGYTSFDDNLAHLNAIMAIWTGGGNFATRVNQLLPLMVTSPGEGQNIFDDNASDLLVGTGGFDWYFANLVNNDGDDAARDLIASLNIIEWLYYQELYSENDD
jgi:Ca2+-binding RTX toxin-like protein